MMDVIDGFSLIRQDFDRYGGTGPGHVSAASGAPKLADVVQKFNAIDHSPEGPGWMPLSDALESSHVADGSDSSPLRDAPQQVRGDEEEGFGLKKSYYRIR